eukprot:CAMPEP_0114528468 /NCGR_PEP_ID=MMETSP0109-20121206/24231_1 /TAXON_ID=29199 /ORGANISM="Chlorarachnion reptans, Strain CCCM449" /LENGTH=122 /DNA_ID=CAMNT_0001710633 /DNA_START=297 /DNA_END=661 /DNA_ORIENTATION=-
MHDAHKKEVGSAHRPSSSSSVSPSSEAAASAGAGRSLCKVNDDDMSGNRVWMEFVGSSRPPSHVFTVDVRLRAFGACTSTSASPTRLPNPALPLCLKPSVTPRREGGRGPRAAGRGAWGVEE